MNKITLSIILVMAFFGLKAQTVITYANHAMNNGDNLTLNRVSYVSPGEEGANQFWDFSKVEIKSDYEINYNEDFTIYPNRPAGNAFLCTENVNRKPYFQITPNQKLYYGVDGKNVEIRFEQPLVDMVYPFAYLDEFSGDMNGTYTVKSRNETTVIEGKYTVKADAWGTVILPDGSQVNNVLRVKTVKDYSHDFYNVNYNVIVTRYAFYAPNSRYAIFQIQEIDYLCDCGCNTNERVAYYNPQASMDNLIYMANVEEGSILKNQTLDMNYNVYPNPFKSNFTLEYNLESDSQVAISLIDMAGKEVKSIRNAYQKAGNYTINENVKDLGASILILRLQINDEVYIEKLTKE